MPHIVVLYSANLDVPDADMQGLCRRLADALLTLRDDAGKPVFPTGGVRALAYPAPHFAVADGSAPGPDGHGFVYVNLRMGKGRSSAVRQATGAALQSAADAHFARLRASRHFGLTLQIDEGAEVFDARLGNLHPLFPS